MDITSFCIGFFGSHHFNIKHKNAVGWYSCASGADAISKSGWNNQPDFTARLQYWHTYLPSSDESVKREGGWFIFCLIKYRSIAQ